MPFGKGSEPWTIRPAEEKDFVTLEKFLDTLHLPTQGIKKHLRHFVVLILDGHIVGTIGLEIYGKRALLRSLGVAENHRGKGYGRFWPKLVTKKSTN